MHEDITLHHDMKSNTALNEKCNIFRGKRQANNFQHLSILLSHSFLRIHKARDPSCVINQKQSPMAQLKNKAKKYASTTLL